LFPLDFLLQFSVLSVAFCAVISTFFAVYYTPTTRISHVFAAVARFNVSSFSKSFHYIQLCIDAQVTSFTTTYVLL
jgi:hypothetical protein